MKIPLMCLFLCSGLWYGCSAAGELPVHSLVASERAFAALSLAKDTRTAFLAFLDDSSIIFRPHPVNGKEWMSRQPVRPSILTWKPVYADCSVAGDLGYTTGPWQLARSSAPNEPIAFGYFVTLWGRRPGGEWRVLLDMGTTNPRPSATDSSVQPGPLSRSRHQMEDRPGTGTLFHQAEERLERSMQTMGIMDAYRAVAADSCRFYREGFFPAIGLGNAPSAVLDASTKPAFTPLAVHVSGSADLAYVYGRYEVPEGTRPGESGYFLRIWSLAPSGTPVLVLDLLSPLERK